ncbi:MAG: hypothetical protein HC904_02040 [Blastochloris sp.]|nr:hypothetical protein [Blastochloris sp.]
MEFIGKDFFVMRPEEKAQRRIAGKVDFIDKKASVRYSDTELSGTYRIFIGDNPKPELIFSVQPDAEESNLVQAPADKVRPFLEGEGKASAPEGGEKGGETGKSVLSGWRAVPPKEFWYFFITAALVVALAEMILAHHFSRLR